MRRLHLLEIEDQPWCPRLLRDGATDYLAEVMRRSRVYDAVAPVLADALQSQGTTTVVDLCSGGGGPWASLAPVLARRGVHVALTLSDLTPNVAALERLAARLPHARVEHMPTDARRVPASLGGFRTLFTAFHHFEPALARAILRDAAQGEGMGIFEVTERSVAGLAMVLPSPLFVWLLTPFMRPIRWTRLLFTYLVPLIPLLVLFDGVVSVLRSYTVHELRAMADAAAPELEWRAGVLRRRVARVTYLVGVPRRLGSGN